MTVRTRVTEGADAYERLIGDAMEGDPRLFARGDTVEASWRVVEPVLRERPVAISYERGTWGPTESDGLVHEHLDWTPCSSDEANEGRKDGHD